MGSRTPGIKEKIVSYLNQNIGKELKIQDIVEATGIDPKKVRRVVRKMNKEAIMLYYECGHTHCVKVLEPIYYPWMDKKKTQTQPESEKETEKKVEEKLAQEVLDLDENEDKNEKEDVVEVELVEEEKQ